MESDNPVTSIELKSNLNELRTGDVVQFDAKAYDKRGNEVTDAPLEFSFKGKSFDKSNTASGLIDNDGRFVADVAGNYTVDVFDANGCAYASNPIPATIPVKPHLFFLDNIKISFARFKTAGLSETGAISS